ncbi:MAG: Chlamydia protein [Chlamydiota bacterium]|jgi:hypothetical protein
MTYAVTIHENRVPPASRVCCCHLPHTLKKVVCDIQQFAHGILGRQAIPASKVSAEHFNQWRRQIFDSNSTSDLLHYTPQNFRLTTAQGTEISAIKLQRNPHLPSKRCILFAGGSGTPCEESLVKGSLVQLVACLEADLVTYNHPGVNDPSVWPSRQGMKERLEACVEFIQKDPQVEVIVIGFSMGGAVALEAAIKVHLIVADRTFGCFSDAVRSATKSRILECAAKVFGWNLSPKDAIKQIKSPVVVLQSAHSCHYERIYEDEKIKNDGIIFPSDTLAQHVDKERTSVFGIPDNHDFGWKSPHQIALIIERYLNRDML